MGVANEWDVESNTRRKISSFHSKRLVSSNIVWMSCNMITIFFKTDKYFAVGEVDIVERSRDEVEGIIPQYLFPFGRIITEE